MTFKNNGVIIIWKVTFKKPVYKVVISVCLFVCMSDHNSWTPWPVCLKFWVENSGEPRECSKLGFKILSWDGGKIVKIVICDQTTVNGGSNYYYPGQRWVL